MYLTILMILATFFRFKIVFFNLKNSSSEMNISIIIAQAEHFKYAQEICDTIELSALLREELELQKRTPEYIPKKDGKQRCSYCIRQWQASWFLLHRKLAGEQLCVAHSGLIVHPDYRNLGLAKKSKPKF
jgi:hypothetical protein